ncbi:helix-turn-helix domain-containing protein [Mucilaginibacter jinjuensis]|uniref:AraC family transcriptional regulator n=1 Tax=Mucilaginibacter jinjuensis TaxID=1176721 RepID=A0ABY7T3Q1_9SPHI|nr:AraC family transcriptional regulator [Mucilaginibacter jinjuensis]WCT10332.1 AraC family transcriptional regulator [Mucilaginibacter jinjuensis]
MRKESLSQLVEVLHSKYEQCTYIAQLTFFQIVYVVSGSGFLHINNNKISYQEGNLMLLTPNDEYRFEVVCPTEFLLVKFARKYVRDASREDVNCLECVLYHAPHVLGCVLKNKPDEPIVKHIAQALIHEIANNDVYSKEAILHFVNALIAVTARNLTKMKSEHIQANADSRIHSIIDYIQTNIYIPEKLRANVIAQKFNLSETYLGTYFKRESGETLSSFITQYKLRLIEHKLKFSDMRINEIVAEFKFSDESHLNKFFKKHKGISLTKFRRD